MNLKIYSPKLAQGNFTNFSYHLLASPFVASADSQGRFIFLQSRNVTASEMLSTYQVYVSRNPFFQDRPHLAGCIA